MFRVINPLKLNDCHINTFLIVILSFQFSFWGLIILDNPIFSSSGIQIQLLRQLMCFVYISYIPGILILRLFKLHNLGNIESLLYITGLSISTLMFTGYSINYISPFFGYLKPISLISLTITISIVVLILCILCYFIDRDYSNPDYIILDNILSSKSIFLFLIPFLSIFGTFLVNYYHTNILLLLMLTLIALIAILIAFDKFVFKEMYPVVIWLMAISLIWHYTLITNYAGVHDGEFYFAKLVIDNNFWDMNSYGNYNSVLSITILPSFIHFICNIDLTWIYKVIFPIFLSFIPLGVYSISHKYVSNKNSFFAAYIFLTASEVYIGLSVITKQLMAVFFLVLFFMVLFNTDINNLKKTFLLIIFSFSLIVSHYGTAYIIVFSLIFVFIFVFLIENQIIKNSLVNNLYAKFYAKSKIEEDSNNPQKNISLNFVLLFTSLTLIWYIYISSSSSFVSIVNIVNNIINPTLNDYFDLNSSRGAYMLTNEYSGLQVIYKYLKLGIPFMMVIGLFNEIITKKSRFSFLYFCFSLYFLFLLIASVAISHFAVMGPTRLYVFSLLVSSPFCILGASRIFNEAPSNLLFKVKYSLKLPNTYYIYFILMMLFSTQLIYVLFNEQPTSISIGQDYIETCKSTDTKAIFYSNLVMNDDILSLKWLDKNGYKNKKIYFTGGYSHLSSVYPNAGYFPMNNFRSFENIESIQKNQYILLIYANNVEKIGFGIIPNVKLFNYFDMNPFNSFFSTKDKIYTNGNSELLIS